jgi:hypothetical protein
MHPAGSDRFILRDASLRDAPQDDGSRHSM